MLPCLAVTHCTDVRGSSCRACRQDGNTLATVSGPNFINDAACLIGTANTGVAIAPAAINIIPELIDVVPTGVGVFPQGAAQPVHANHPVLVRACKLSPWGLTHSRGMLLRPCSAVQG